MTAPTAEAAPPPQATDPPPPPPHATADEGAAATATSSNFDCRNCGDLPRSSFHCSSLRLKIHLCKGCVQLKNRTYFKAAKDTTLLEWRLRRRLAGRLDKLSRSQLASIFGSLGRQCYITGLPGPLTLMLADPDLPFTSGNAVPVLTTLGRALPHLPHEALLRWRARNGTTAAPPSSGESAKGAAPMGATGTVVAAVPTTDILEDRDGARYEGDSLGMDESEQYGRGVFNPPTPAEGSAHEQSPWAPCKTCLGSIIAAAAEQAAVDMEAGEPQMKMVASVPTEEPVAAEPAVATTTEPPPTVAAIIMEQQAPTAITEQLPTEWRQDFAQQQQQSVPAEPAADETILRPSHNQQRNDRTSLG